jgi:hypothetical protein
MSSNYTFSSRVIVDPEVLFRVVGEETVLLNLKTEKYLGLNETATAIWKALAESRSIQDAYDVVLEQFEVDAEELKKDVRELVDALVEQRLIEIAPGG